MSQTFAHDSIFGGLNLFKRFECFYKVYIKGNKKELISAIDSNLYSKRFLKFIKKEVIINEKN